MLGLLKKEVELCRLQGSGLQSLGITLARTRGLNSHHTQNTLLSFRRAGAVLELLKKEVELCRLQADIGKQVEEKISKDQRRYFLQVSMSQCTAVCFV